jgi:hypothetical protein
VKPEKGSDLSAYYARKRATAIWSVAVTIVAGAALGPVSPIAAIAEVFGTFCGILNALLSMRANERLADHRRVGAFVLSSVLRIAVFGIVPVEFALHGPWWTMATYFFGFFTPLAVYAALVSRKLHPDSNL